MDQSLGIRVQGLGIRVLNANPCNSQATDLANKTTKNRCPTAPKPEAGKPYNPKGIKT